MMEGTKLYSLLLQGIYDRYGKESIDSLSLELTSEVIGDFILSVLDDSVEDLDDLWAANEK